jgi:hypothetical protein
MGFSPWFDGTLQVFAQPIQAFAPEAAMEIEPICCLAKTRRIEPAGAKRTVALLCNEPRSLQNPQVPRDGGQGNIEWLCELADICRAARQARKDRAPCRVGEGGKGVVKRSGIHLTNSLINKIIN